VEGIVEMENSRNQASYIDKHWLRAEEYALRGSHWSSEKLSVAFQAGSLSSSVPVERRRCQKPALCDPRRDLMKAPRLRSLVRRSHSENNESCRCFKILGSARRSGLKIPRSEEAESEITGHQGIGLSATDLEQR
jgi:hypothetical protein